MTFPLVPRGRLVGLSFGTMRSLRRGIGSDVAGSRPYTPGDDVHTIDWAATARISSARESDEFVVRELYAEEAPCVVIVADRRPEMSFFSPPLPWLDKAKAVRETAELIIESTNLEGGYVGYLDFAEGDAHWERPRTGRRLHELRERRLHSTHFSAPADTLDRALLELIEHRRSIFPGSFVFVLSDFVPPPSDEGWLRAREHRWDAVPVVIQDPLWEQSFPDVGGIEVPLRDPRTGGLSPVRLTTRRAAALRRAHETRLAETIEGFRLLDLDPVVVSSADPAEILAVFLEWADLRRARRAA